jgi:hypothetical protein
VKYLGIGLTHSEKYGECPGCDVDISRVVDLIEKAALGTVCTVLENKRATAAAILDALRSVLACADPAEVILIHYSGHTGQMPDASGDETTDGLDEFLCAYDSPILDDQWLEVMSTCKPRQRILGIFDTCHSETGYRGTGIRRNLPFSLLRRRRARARAAGFQGQYIHFAGCREAEYSMGSATGGGLWTKALCDGALNGARTTRGGFGAWLKKWLLAQGFGQPDPTPVSATLTWWTWFDAAYPYMPRQQRPVRESFGDVMEVYKQTPIWG